MPATRQSSDGSADAPPPRLTRMRSGDPGASSSSSASLVLTMSGVGWPGADRGGQRRPLHDVPRAADRVFGAADERDADAGVIAAGRHRRGVAGAEERDPLNARQPPDGVRQRRRAGERRAVNRRSLARDHPDVVAGGVEQIAERDQQSPREQQHVEQQRADDGDAADREKRPPGVVDERPPGQAPGGHRRTSVTMSRRSSVHDPTRPATIPSGTARATDCSAIRAVTWTNTSVVS